MSSFAMRCPVLVILLLLYCAPGQSLQPSPAAVAAYKRAIADIEQQRAESRRLSCSAHGERENAILIQRLPIRDSGGRPVRAHAALIHHWGAAMFIANVRPEDVTAVLQDYDHHAEIYAPEVSFS